MKKKPENHSHPVIRQFQLDDADLHGPFVVPDVPAGAKVLSFELVAGNPGQNHLPSLFVLCDDASPGVPRGFACVSTDEILPSEAADCVYIGTVQLPTGRVVHLFDGGEIPHEPD